MIRALALACCMLPAILGAETLTLPARAFETTQTVTTPDALRIATGPFEAALPHIVAEGTLSRSAWTQPQTEETTIAVLETLRAQLDTAGFTPVFSCAASQCGGFDFRFALDVVAPPAMQVNLADYHYWAGTRGDEHAVILISKIANTAFIQIDRITTEESQVAPTVAVARPTQTIATRSAPDSLIGALEADGRVILSDLSFALGSATLADDDYTSLATLAAYLKEDPTLLVALVGHTDTAGSLEGNIALSRKRANAVKERLIARYGIPSRQMDAEGMGYLAPVANNLYEAGREANRRVEVIIVGVAK